MRLWFVAAAFVLAMAAFLLAPLALWDSYDMVQHTTSEAAGQGVTGSWVARFGFLLYASGVTAACWGRGALAPRWLHLGFAGCLVGVAVFASKPWTDAPYDATEDALHSFFATAMGFAFAAGVVWHAWVRGIKALDVVAVAASVVLPIGMATTSYTGILQRLMFAVAAVWYVRVAWQLRASGPTSQSHEADSAPPPS